MASCGESDKLCGEVEIAIQEPQEHNGLKVRIYHHYYVGENHLLYGLVISFCILQVSVSQAPRKSADCDPQPSSSSSAGPCFQESIDWKYTCKHANCARIWDLPEQVFNERLRQAEDEDPEAGRMDLDDFTKPHWHWDTDTEVHVDLTDVERASYE